MTLKLATKTAKTKSELEHQRLASLINSMADAVVALDSDAKIVMYNAAALNIFDVNMIKTGSRLDSVFRPVDKNNHPFDIVNRVKATNTPLTDRDLRLKYDDGSAINLYIS